MKRPIPKCKNKKAIRSTKNKLGGKIMKRFVGLKAKTYCYLIGWIDGSEECKNEKNKNVNDTKNNHNKGN